MGGLSSFVGNLTGGLVGTSDAERASGKAAALSEASKKEILGELDLSWKDVEGYLSPWLKEGQRGLSMYKDAIGAAPDAPVFEGFSPDIEDFTGFKSDTGDFEGFSFDASKLEQNPAYQFVRDQALQAVNRSAAAGRGLTSGNRMTALADYAGGLASTEYGNEFGRQLQTYQTTEQAKARNLARDYQRYGTEQDAISGNLSRMRDIYGTGEEAKGRTFDVRNLLNRQRVGDTSHLMSFGPTFATNLATMRDRLSGARAGAQSNYAAEQTAAALIPAQEKMSFMGNLMGAGGMAAGGYFSR